MESFFFIPATKISNVEKIQKLAVDHIIIDFEDSVIHKELDELVAKVNESHFNLWFRIPLRNDFEQKELDLKTLNTFVKIGVRKFVLPKLFSAQEFIDLKRSLLNHHKLEFILLIEHPRFLIEVGQLLQNPVTYNCITGLGLGSHDLAAFLNAEHSSEILNYPRFKMLYLAKAYGKVSIDIASMNITNEVSYIDEVISSRRSGFDAKFLIHPNQVNWFNSPQNVDIKKITWAKKIVSKLPESYNGGDIEPFIVEGIVVEKPHILKALEIIKEANNGK